MTISEMLKALVASGLSQAEIGEQAGVSQPTICRAFAGADLKYEVGKKIENLYRERIGAQRCAA